MNLKEGIPINIVAVKPTSGYKLQITFDDGHVSTVDFGAFLRSAHHAGVQKYRDMTQFKSVSIVHGNLVWGDYDMCFPIEDLDAGDVMQHTHSAQLHAVAESKTKYATK